MASRGTDKFAGIGWSPTAQGGSPRLDGVLGYVDCALLFYRGRYGTTEVAQG